MTDQELDERFESFGAKLKADISAAIKAEGLITRRHFDIVAEALKAEIKVIADGHAALRDDVSLQPSVLPRSHSRQLRRRRGDARPPLRTPGT